MTQLGEKVSGDITEQKPAPKAIRIKEKEDV